MRTIKVGLIVGIVTILTSCGGIKTSSSGLENQSYLEFLGIPSNYSEGIQVDVDKQTHFEAKVVKEKITRTKETVYAISAGTHNITIKYKGKVIISRKIFVSAQETKKIELP